MAAHLCLSFDPNLEAILGPFRHQSAQITSIVAMGCNRLWPQNREHSGDARQTGAADDAVLLRLVGNGDTDVAIGTRVPIAPVGGASSGKGIHTFDSLARRARELTDNALGDHLFISPDHLLEEMILPLANDFGFRAVVALSPPQSNRSGDENVWRLQRTLFDRGFIGIGSVPVIGGEARCFIASDAVRSLHHLGNGSRGRVTMSSLGSNGRFANQLFQYSYLKLYSLRHGLTAAVPAWEGSLLFGSEDPPCAGVALPQLRFGAFTDDDRALWDKDDPPIDVDLWGYFQEIPRCWQRHRHLLRRLFTLSREHECALDAWHYDVTRAGNRPLVAIHVRRGDYRDLHGQGLPWFRLVPEEYYLAWLRALWPTLRDPVLYVATDEPEAILPIFRDFKPILATLAPTPQVLPDHVRDFEILRRADYLAICNGSFSRMASILSHSTQESYYPSFQARGFVPYEPWIDPGFWARFANATSPPSKQPCRPSLMSAARIIYQSLMAR